MALNDIYRVIHTQEYGAGGPRLLNVYYYEQTLPGDPEGAEELATLFDFYVKAQVKAIQNQIIRNVTIEVQNVIAGPDYFQLVLDPTTDIGLRTGESLPPYATWAFRLARTTTASRNGQKRYSGVSEGDQNNGIAVGAMAPIFDQLEAVLDAPLPSAAPNTTQYTPRIFRPAAPAKTIPAKTIPAKLQAVFPMGEASYVALTTQNTRKFNQGA